MKYYAVQKGRDGPKIYTDWDSCERSVKGFVGNKYKSFKTLEEAQAYLGPPPTAQREVLAAPPHRAALKKRPREASPPTPVREEEDALSVYVDGACSANGKGGKARAGYGGYYGSASDGRNFSLPLPLHNNAQTNNRAEMMAVLHVLQQALSEAQGSYDPTVHHNHAYGTSCAHLPIAKEDLVQPLRQLHIYTDSKYTLDGLTKYSKKWMRNGFKLSAGGDVLNQDIWKPLISHYNAYNHYYQQQRRTAGSVGVVLHYVKGHSSIHGNEMADKLAVEGSRRHTS
ncbi:ribonuclease HI [Angomonas deanei]|nr:ribonuclease HI [Angomonas deanei]|eukprot:EPY35969.1 ribonuclease HI [Angomonas deanei]